MTKLLNVKTLAATFLLASFTPTANGQLEEAKWMIGGTGNVRGSNHFLNLLIEPSAGYFIRPQIELGGRISYQFMYSKSDYSLSLIGVNPYARYYFRKPESKLNIFGEVSLKASTVIGQEMLKNYAYLNTDVSAGLLYFISPKFVLELKTTFTPRTNFLQTPFNTTLGFKYRIGH